MASHSDLPQGQDRLDYALWKWRRSINTVGPSRSGRPAGVLMRCPQTSVAQRLMAVLCDNTPNQNTPVTSHS